jgi:hypothetical protein
MKGMHIAGWAAATAIFIIVAVGTTITNRTSPLLVQVLRLFVFLRVCRTRIRRFLRLPTFARLPSLLCLARHLARRATPRLSGRATLMWLILVAGITLLPRISGAVTHLARVGGHPNCTEYNGATVFRRSKHRHAGRGSARGQDDAGQMSGCRPSCSARAELSDPRAVRLDIAVG